MTLLDRPDADTVDAARWPNIARVPHSPARAAVAAQVWRRVVNRLPLRVIEPGGRGFGGGGADAPRITLVRPKTLFERIGAAGPIGFGEGFMAGDWTTDDLAGVLSVFAGDVAARVPNVLFRLRNAVLGRMPRSQDNTIEGARRNIQHHYDLSNAMFETFLDESLTYSCALFDGDPAVSQDELAVAQRRKIDRLLDAVRVGPGTRLLEIGTGWGELSLRAAARGASVTSLTISTEQAELARKRIAAAGLAERATVLLQDYREAQGRFDAVLSVEMIEAVGANHWASYFGTVDRVLEPGGRFGLQAILQDDRIVRATQDSWTWIRKYIFPGGQCASVEAIERTCAAHTSLRIADRYHFGRHYAETLRRWRERFEAKADKIEQLGFDEVFRRMWSLYLAYCEAGFRTGYLDVAQLTLIKAPPSRA